LANNTIKRNTIAQLMNFSAVETTGNAIIKTISNGSIKSLSTAAAISLAKSDNFAAGLAGGGANSFNTITGNSAAQVSRANFRNIDGSTLINQAVGVSATDTTLVDAQVQAVSLAWSHADNELAVGIGAAIARNFVGETQGNNASSGGSPVAYSNFNLELAIWCELRSSIQT
jgi:hypothetical protein